MKLICRLTGCSQDRDVLRKPLEPDACVGHRNCRLKYVNPLSFKESWWSHKRHPTTSSLFLIHQRCFNYISTSGNARASWPLDAVENVVCECVFTLCASVKYEEGGRGCQRIGADRGRQGQWQDPPAVPLQEAARDSLLQGPKCGPGPWTAPLLSPAPSAGGVACCVSTYLSLHTIGDCVCTQQTLYSCLAVNWGM